MRQWNCDGRRLELESLDERLMLSGVVFVVYDADTQTLLVMGDDAANQIVIGTDETGSTTVTGQTGTLVLGDRTVTDEVSVVAVDLGAGDDSVVVEDTTAATVAISTGDGNDSVVVHSDLPLLAVQLGTGDDQLSVEQSSLGILAVDAGEGNDSVAIDGATIAAAGITLQDGHDTLSSTNSTFANLSVALFGPGDDTYFARDNTYDGLTAFVDNGGTDSADAVGNVYTRGEPFVYGFEQWS